MPRNTRDASEFVRMLVGVLRWKLAASLAASLALAFAEGTGLVLLVPLLGTIGLAVDQGPVNRVASLAARGFAWLGLQPSLPAVLGVFLVVSALQALLYRTYLVLNPTLGQEVAFHLQQRLYRAVVTARWSLLVRLRSSDLIHAVTIEADRVSVATYQFLTLIAGIIVAAAYVLVAARLSPALTLLVGASGVAVLWLVRSRTRASGDRGASYSDASRALFSMTSESVAGVKIAKSIGAESRDLAVFETLARAALQQYAALMQSYASAKFRLDLASAVLVAALLLVAVEVLHVNGAGLLLLVLIFMRLVPRVIRVQEAAQTFAGALPAYAAIARLVAECESESERPAPLVSPRLRLTSRLELDEVRFAYTSEREVLKGVTLALRAGSITGLAGASGTGKSTVADIVMGLLRPSSGRVIVDGREIGDEDLHGWRRSIGYVPQDTFLLHDTIRANLLWARPDATEEAMWRALEQAAAAGFVRARPEGLDVVVGDRGVRLSGGERQRLALARALLLEPDLLILDEATSALDAANEQQILQAVHALAGGVTVLLITHRLAALRDADLVYVFADGHVLESGTWTDLAGRTGGEFRRLLSEDGREAGQEGTLRV